MKQQEAFDLLNAQLNDIPKAQIRSLSLAVLPRLMDVLDSNQATCSHCKKYSTEGEVFVKDIAPLFQQDTLTTKKFEQWVDESQKHLKNAHQQQVRGRITSLYTAIGMALGVLIAWLCSLLFPNQGTFTFIGLGWAIGMLAGYFSGKLKENKLKQTNKLY